MSLKENVIRANDLMIELETLVFKASNCSNPLAKMKYADDAVQLSVKLAAVQVNILTELSGVQND